MAKLRHRIGRVRVVGQEQGGEGVPQLVGRQALGQWPVGSLERQLLGFFNYRVHHPLTGVVYVAVPTPCRGEHRLEWSDLPSACEIGAELVAEHREQVDLPSRRVGLGPRNFDSPRRQVDVMASKRTCLPDPKSREYERCHERPPARSPRVRLGVEFRCCVEHGGDLIHRIEIDRPRSLGLHLAAPRIHTNRVTVDQLALMGDVENLAEASERPVDRPRR
ncbi:MAG: hypothetical protein AABM66_12715 [Actinomycetota bacterium]